MSSRRTFPSNWGNREYVDPPPEYSNADFSEDLHPANGRRTRTRTRSIRQTLGSQIHPPMLGAVRIKEVSGAFNPASQFLALPCEVRVAPMNVDMGEESLGELRQGLKAQSELDMCAEGLEVSSLSRLMGSEAVSYTSRVEELYEKMLVKIESLARQVESSSAS